MPATSVGVVSSSTDGAAPPSEKFAFPKLAKIFVPLPSLASTDPEEKVNGADPAAFTLKLIAIIFPDEPVKPGFKAIPSKFTVPAKLENEGSCTHKLIIELLLERETTCNLSAGNEITPEAAFIA